MEMKYKKFVASLHTHVKSLYDAQIEAKSLCDKIKELGGNACAITDHGVLTSIMDYKSVFDAEGVKLIPGCELYIENGDIREHFIVLAKNYNGYMAISKMVTASNKNIVKNFPLLKKEVMKKIMEEYRGDVVATTACMQGVLATPFLENIKIEKQIEKLRHKQSDYENPASENMVNTYKELENRQRDLDEAVLNRDMCKKFADMKFTAREKAVIKLETSGAETAVVARKELEDDKKNSETAKNTLEDMKNQVEEKRKELSQIKKVYKDLLASAECYVKIEEDIKALVKQKKNDDAIMEKAISIANYYTEIFGKDNFYIEVQYHGIPEEAVYFPKAVEVAKKTGLQLIASNDVHTLTGAKEDRLKRQILRSLRFGKSFEEEYIGDDQLYLKDNNELSEWLEKILAKEDVTEAICNIEKVANECNVIFEFEKHYPEYPCEDGKTPLEIFDEKIAEGIKWRFPDGFPTKEYEERVEYERKIICEMGYIDYHLIVCDFLQYGRRLGCVPPDKISEAPLTIEELEEFIDKNGWKNETLRIGPGRGSAVGSLICYLLGITALDPIPLDLLFERFLNPERISMPDIDSDISNKTREKVIEYVKNKYGNESICGILTQNAQAPKGSINIAAKFYGLKKYEKAMTDKGRVLSKLVPSDVGISFQSLVQNGKISKEGDMTLYEWMLKQVKNTDEKEIIQWANAIEGIFTAYSTHAAGIGIMKKGENIGDYIPLKWSDSMQMMTTQCDMIQFEDAGFLKFDFLGLKTLDIISETLSLIEQNHGKIINPLELDLNDERVYKEILQTGQTNSVFQLESSGMKSCLKRLKPICFEDIIIVLSLYRPGPMQYLDSLIEVKNGEREISFLCPELEPILENTYGTIVYQEQVMKIFRDLAGFSLGGADTVRRYMSKKKLDKLEHERTAFIYGDETRNIEGCIKKGIKVEVATQLFDEMLDFAKYAFNKSHAAAYALNSFITAWLKCYYPAEFFCSALNWADKNEDIRFLIYEAKSFGIEVLAPAINSSEKDFCTINGKILFGLKHISGVKNNADEIIKQRKSGNYTDLKDFCTRTGVNIKVTQNLISSGAMECFCTNREALSLMADEIKECIEKLRKKQSFLQAANLLLPNLASLTTDDELIEFQISNGCKAEIKEITTAEKLMGRIENAKKAEALLYDDLSLIRVQKIVEDKKMRLYNEKEVLGTYVTAHPLDYYPDIKSLGIECPIYEVSEENSRIYGVITNLKICNRKSDGAEMAFFDLEDCSGSIPVVCFAKEYEKYKKYIEDGSVVTISGNCNVETEFDGENEVITKQFIAQAIKTVDMELSTVILTVPSYALFYIDAEDGFRNLYEKRNGHKLVIYDESMDEYIQMKYKVNESIFSSGLPISEL